jgi:tRNA U34 5-methylaminomethyl-2-thiouridine-forming methyltransferase MnmC
MRQVITKDGSITYFNEQFQEHYHSTSGAIEEALKKFAMPLEPYLEKKDNVIVLDVCFGLGYTSAAFVEYYAERFKHIEIVCLEIDKAIVEKMLDLKTQFSCYTLFKEFAMALMHNATQFESSFKGTKVSFSMFWGDASETIKQVKKVDAVLFDPFSPKKHPELWSKDFLQNVKNVMSPGSALTTYSCAKTFRDTLRELNFQVVNGPCVGRKAPSTIAVNQAFESQE